MTELKVEVADEYGQLKALAAQVERSLSALEQLPEFPLDGFLRLGHALAHDVGIAAGSPAATTSDGRIVLGVFLHLELLATALTALEHYLCHETSPSLA